MTQSNTSDRRSFLKAGAVLGAGLMATHAITGAGVNQFFANPKDYSAIKHRRKLGSGKHQIEVSALGLGCMGMSYHRSFIPDKKVSIGVIRNAYEMGVNFFDTAEAYGPFKNEELVGEAIAPFRKNIILCSKFGFNIQNGQLAGLNSKPGHIREVVEQSLKRLKTDYIDLLYQHVLIPTCPWKMLRGQ